MLNPTPKRIVRALCSGLVLLLFAAWLSGSHGEICEQAKSGAEQCTVYNLAFFVLIEIGRFLNDTAVAVTAIATAVIGYFTYTLKRSTDKLWEAHERQLIADNRAWLSIEDVKLIHPTKFTEEGFIFRLSATVKHHGETPATSVWLAYESYYHEENEITFAVAQEQFRTKLRTHPVGIGESLFKGDSLTQRELWVDGPDKTRRAIKARPTGERKFNFTIFIGVSYRVFGDPVPRITQYAHGMLNVSVRTEIPDGQETALRREPFIAGQIE